MSVLKGFRHRFSCRIKLLIINKNSIMRYKSKVNYQYFFGEVRLAARMPLEVNVLMLPTSIEMVSRKNGGSLNGSDTGKYLCA